MKKLPLYSETLLKNTQFIIETFRTNMLRTRTVSVMDIRGRGLMGHSELKMNLLHFDNLNGTDKSWKKERQRMSDEHSAVWFVQSMHGF